MSIFPEMLLTALRRSQKNGGYGSSERNNFHVHVSGKWEFLWTFVGVEQSFQGEIRIRHYRSDVFAIDFVKKRITDFGMHGYSHSTGNCVSGFRHAIFDRFVPNEGTIHAWSYSNWTNEPPARHTGVAEAFVHFAKKIPWAKRDDAGVTWFYWKKYNPALADVYWNSVSALRDDQAWRYFTYDWDQDGNWTRKFKDDDAQRLYFARARRRLKKKKAA